MQISIMLNLINLQNLVEEGEMDWCQPVVVSDGEQLVQLCGGITVKMRIRMHPYSSYIELQEVDHVSTLFRLSVLLST